MNHTKLTDQQTKHIAKLAKIHLDEQQVSHLTAEMSNILTMVQTLDSIDCNAIEPLAHPLEDTRSTLRNDMVTETDQRDSLQLIAPKVSTGLYLVPQVIE